jgi:dihydrofolate synthase/folylpolyglutamate synthase
MTPRFSCLDDWLRWQEQLHPAAIELGLARIRPVAERVLQSGLTSTKPFTITVAGTNGKGSCVSTLGAMLKALGKRVGTFTSPHLLHYNERIRIDGDMVSDAALCDAFAAIDNARGDISLTYFEFNALAALYLFQQQRVDVQVLEVGLGGRLDAVNILDADIAVITNIALDHTDWLGDTRDLIGAEKAGILRAQGKLVYGEADMPASIQQQIEKLGVACHQAGDAFTYAYQSGQIVWTVRNEGMQAQQLITVVPALPLPSVACALQVLCWMGCWKPDVIRAGIASLQLAGRFEQRTLHHHRLVLDVAHNAAGADFLCQQLQQTGFAPVDCLFAVMADKDIVSIVRALQPVIENWVLMPLADNPRAASIQQLEHILLEQGVPANRIHSADHITQAFAQLQLMSDHRTWLVAGSFFTVSAVQSWLTHAD